MEQLEGVPADAQRDVAGEHDRALVRIAVVVVPGGKDGLTVGVVGGECLVGVVERVDLRPGDHELVAAARGG